jgi:L-malate glycosyltransferase
VNRGHRLTFFGREPVHPDFLAALEPTGVAWKLLSSLERNPIRSAREIQANFDVAHLNLIAPRARAALIAYAAWPTRVLFVDRVSSPETQNSAPKRRSFLHRTVDRLTFARLSGYAGVSNYIRDKGVNRFQLSQTRARTIYNGVDVRRFSPGEQLVGDGQVRVLTVAHLIRDKGVDHLLRAFAMVSPSSRLIVVGDGPELPELRYLARGLGVDSRVDFLGLRDDVPRLLRSADIFVHPAVWAEAFANAPSEAMASGCAVIATATGGTPELIEDGTSGLLVPPADVNALASALEMLLVDQERRVALGANARTRVEERFALARAVAEHLDWCEASAE